MLVGAARATGILNEGGQITETAESLCRLKLSNTHAMIVHSVLAVLAVSVDHLRHSIVYRARSQNHPINMSQFFYNTLYVKLYFMMVTEK